MDVHVPFAITMALRARMISAVTAQEDGADELDDDKLLQRATQLGCILVTQDEDFLRVGARLQNEGKHFTGIVYAHQDRVTIGQMVEGLELIVRATMPEEWESRVGRLAFLIAPRFSFTPARSPQPHQSHPA